MIERFSIFARKYRGTLIALPVATAGSAGIFESVMLNYDSFVQRLAEDRVRVSTSENIRDVDIHNKKYPDDLWEYEHYSIEDVLDPAKSDAVIILAIMIILVVAVSLFVGTGYDAHRARAALAAAPLPPVGLPPTTPPSDREGQALTPPPPQ